MSRAEAGVRMCLGIPKSSTRSDLLVNAILLIIKIKSIKSCLVHAQGAHQMIPEANLLCPQTSHLLFSPPLPTLPPLHPPLPDGSSCSLTSTPLIPPRCHEISDPQGKLKCRVWPIIISFFLGELLSRGTSRTELLGNWHGKVVMLLSQVALTAGFGCLRQLQMFVPTTNHLDVLLGLEMVLVDKLREVARRLSGIEGGLQGDVSGGFIE